MGLLLDRDSVFRNKTYVIGLTSYYGLGSEGIILKKRNSLEDWIHKQGIKYSFVNLQPIKAINPLGKAKYRSKLLGYYLTSYWHKIFDGIIYIDKALSCESY